MMPLKRSKMLLLATTGICVGAYAYAKKDGLRDYVSALCEFLATEPVICSDLARDAFTQNCVDPVVPTLGHTHASAASLRVSATNFAHNVAQHCGGEVFSVEMSKSDQRKGMRGSRRWYWTKDVNSDNRNDEPRDNDVRYLCDVDYYIDMNEKLVEHINPVVLYTVVPEEAVSSGEDDTTFCFQEDGSLKTLVAGGGTYEHHLWDYASDSFLVVKKRFGVPVRAVAYAVERKQVARHRQLVLFAPIRVFDGVAAVLASYLLETKELRRFNPVVEAGGEKFIRFNTVRPDGSTVVSTARPGTLLCATVTCAEDESVAIASRLGTTNLMLPTVASWVKERAAAAVLTEYHRCKGPKAKFVVYPVEQGVRAYQYKPLEFDPEAKPKLQGFMSPIVHQAFVPVANKAGEEQCVRGRINSLKKPEPKPSTFRDRCMDEFANLIMEGVHLEPVCFEVVNAKQTSSAQKLSLVKAVLTGHWRPAILKCFIKAEAYTGLKDPRNISTYNDADKLDMAMFALSLSEHLKKFKWYGPGKTPREIAERVAEVCSVATYVNISDYHRMDGTITYTLRKVDRAVCMKAFANHSAVLNELLKRNVDNRGKLPHGTQFEQGSTQGSGCSATSLFQTIRAAFNAYLAFRHTRKVDGTTYSPREAFDALGIHLGDDGLDANLAVESHRWASQRTGLILEAAVIQRGDRGVNFLARYYSPAVWEGQLDSMCDIKRQLSKFHTTVRLPSNVSPEQKFVEKAMSYVATDGNTPVISELCKRVLLLSPYRPKSLHGIGSWWSKFDQSVQFPNNNVDGWMDVEFGVQFPEFDRNLFNCWMDSVRSTEELLQAPLCAEPRAATPTNVDVVVDQEIVPSQSCDEPRTNAKDEKEKRTTRVRKPRSKPPVVKGKPCACRRKKPNEAPVPHRKMEN